MSFGKSCYAYPAFYCLMIGIVLLFSAAAPAQAQGTQPVESQAPVETPLETPAQAPAMSPPKGGVDILPAASLVGTDVEYDMDAVTHPVVNMTPDKSEILKLDSDVTTVIVGNPSHLSVLADSPRTLILVARAAGATFFTALDNKGNVIMQRHVIVASPKEKYVRIRKSCAAAGTSDCLETQVYYCPDMCHEIIMNGSESSGDGGNAGGPLPANEADNTATASTSAEGEAPAGNQPEPQ